jgi:hypothetical protein
MLWACFFCFYYDDYMVRERGIGEEENEKGVHVLYLVRAVQLVGGGNGRIGVALLCGARGAREL